MILKNIKANPNNPRIIKNERFNKLVQSIREFPKMMELRPMVIDADNMVLGGNMRLKALKELEYEEIPNNWVKRAKDLTEEEVKRFIIIDNVGFGDDDWNKLQSEWDIVDVEEWGLEMDPKKSVLIKDPDDFEKKMSEINDDNCLYPIVPLFDEKHEIFIITCSNEIDSNWIRERLNMQKMKSYKRAELSKSNIVSFKDFKDAIENSNTKS